MSAAMQFRHFALAGICATGFLSIPWQVYERRADIRAYVERVISAVQAKEIGTFQPSPYLSAPGNRVPCSEWIGKQADGSQRPWIVKCTRRARG